MIFFLQSVHDNGQEDRQWTVECAQPVPGVALGTCMLSQEANGLDSPMDFQVFYASRIDLNFVLFYLCHPRPNLAISPSVSQLQWPCTSDHWFQRSKLCGLAEGQSVEIYLLRNHD